MSVFPIGADRGRGTRIPKMDCLYVRKGKGRRKGNGRGKGKGTGKRSSDSSDSTGLEGIHAIKFRLFLIHTPFPFHGVERSPAPAFFFRHGVKQLVGFPC